MSLPRNAEFLEEWKIKIEELIKEKVEFRDEKNNIITDIDFLKDSTYNAFYRISVDKKRFTSSFALSQLPGCCAYMISYHSRVYFHYRNKGLGLLLNSFRIEIARRLGYTALLCTDVDDNQHQRKILSKNGWKDVHTLVNKRTNHLVHLSVIDL